MSNSRDELSLNHGNNTDTASTARDEEKKQIEEIADKLKDSLNSAPRFTKPKHLNNAKNTMDFAERISENTSDDPTQNIVCAALGTGSKVLTEIGLNATIALTTLEASPLALAISQPGVQKAAKTIGNVAENVCHDVYPVLSEQLKKVSNMIGKKESVQDENKLLELSHKKLIEATKINDLKKMTEALDEGADINALSEAGAVWPGWKCTALHAAAMKGHTQAVELLLSRGAHVNAKCSSGSTPLQQAALHNHHTDIVHKLITAGADPTTARDIAKKHNQITNAYFEKLLAAQSLTHFQNGCELFEQKKDYPSALKETNEAIRLNPNYAEAYCLRGSCYRETGKLQEAVAAYNFAINLNPKYPWSYYNRSITYTKLNEHQKALNDANKFLEICPGNASGIAMRNAAQSKLQPKPQAVVTQPKPAIMPPPKPPAAQPKPVASPKPTFTFSPKKPTVQPKSSVVQPKPQFDFSFLQKKPAVVLLPKPPATQPKPVVNSSTVHLNSAIAMANDVSKRVQAEQDKWRQEQDRKYREQLAREQREREERTRQEARQRAEQERRREEERKRAHQQHMDYLCHLNKTSTAFGKPSIGQASGGGFFSSSSNKLDCIYPTMGVNGSNGSMGKYCRQGDAPFYTYNNPSTGKRW